jgi:NAD(P)-dependent dehydrogenase (short-subunit alcohol dehydrogenase family)
MQSVCAFLLACFSLAHGASLEGKVAFITGASSGIGDVVSKYLAEQGMKVVLTARRKDKLQANVEAITKAGGTAVAKECDVSDGKSVADAFAFTEETYGGVDFVFANAGYEGASMMKLPFESMPDEEMANVYNINVVGAMYTLKQSVLAFQKRGSGTIAFSSSIAGCTNKLVHAAVAGMGLPGTGIIYMSSKVAMDGVIEGAIGSYGDKNISVYGLNIAEYSTDMRARALGEQKEAGFNPIFKQQVGDPIHIAEAIAAILDGSSLWPAGSHITLDNDATFESEHICKSRVGGKLADPATFGWTSPEELFKIAKNVKGAPYNGKMKVEL